MVRNMKNISIAARTLVIGVVVAMVLAGIALGAEVIFQDDFEKDLSQWTKETGTGDFSISTNQAHTGKSSLHVSLTATGGNGGHREFSNDLQGTVTVWFYDTMNTGGSFIYLQNVPLPPKGESYKGDVYAVLLSIVGDSSNYDSKYYGLAGGPEWSASNILRSKGWHKAEFDVTEKGTTIRIDDIEQSVKYERLTKLRLIQLALGWNSQGDIYFDDVRFTPISIAPSLVLTKSLSPSTITEGDSTTVTLRVENTGGDAKSVKITDAIPQGLTLVSGSASQEYATLKATESRTIQYTVKAAGTGRFVSDLATVTYQDDKGNSYSGASNSATITVQAGQAGEVPAAQPKTPGFGVILAGIGIISALALRRR